MLPAKLDNASVAADVCGLAVARKEDAATSMAGGPACTLPGGRGPVPTIVEDLVRNFGGFDVSGPILYSKHSLRSHLIPCEFTY